MEDCCQEWELPGALRLLREYLCLPLQLKQSTAIERERERERGESQRSSIWIQSSFPAKSQLFSLKVKSVRGKRLCVCVLGVNESEKRETKIERG